MSSFGWSAGDIAAACVILYHITQAFDTAKGAPKQYRDSHAFLCGLYLVVSYVSDEARASHLSKDAQLQIQTISNAYMDLHAYVLKYTKIDNSERSRLRAVLPTIRWSLNELNNKVQALKNNSLGAIAIMETLIVMDLSSKMNNMLTMGGRQEQSLEIATTVLTDVREQLANLSQVSEEYEKLLEDMSQSGDVHATELSVVQGRLDNISRSQHELQEKLGGLTKHLEDRACYDQAREEQWRKLLEGPPEKSEYEKNVEGTQKDLNDTKELVGGMGDVTGDHRIQNAGVKVQGVSRVFGALTSSKFGKGFFGSSRDEPSEPVSAPRSTPNINRGASTTSTATQSRERRAYKPPPAVTHPPPPQRIGISLPAAHSSSQHNVQTMSRPRNQSSSVPGNSMQLSPPPESRKFPSTGLTKPREHGKSSSPPPLPPRSMSTPASPSAAYDSTSTETPALPPRRVREPTSLPPDSLALAIIETPPPLPVRAYRNQTMIIPKSPAAVKAPPKPLHLSSASLSASPGPAPSKPSMTRVSSASSSSSTSSTVTFNSLSSSISSVSSASSEPSVSAKSPHIAELIKTLESRKVSSPPTAGGRQILPGS